MSQSHRENQKGFRVCRKADMKKFAEELSSVLEWMVNHCFSLQNVSSMREEIKKQFEWDESLSGSDVSSLACKDHELPSKVVEEEAKDKPARYICACLNTLINHRCISDASCGILVAVLQRTSSSWRNRKTCEL